ncbi:CTNA1 protein, partial [Heliornis fulica]|nr:CTNA1 protein [Heliornis fulica]
VRAASWLLESLSVVRDAGDTPGLLAAFRASSEALLLLSNLTAKHLEELGDCPQGKRLAQTLRLLQEQIPSLHMAKHSQLKRSCDQQVTLSGDPAFQLAERTIKELTSLLIDTMGNKEPPDRSGTFSQHVSKLLALLSCPDRLHLSGHKFSTQAEAVVFSCMLLADWSRPDLKLDLLRRCRVLLQLKESICSHVRQWDRWPERCQGESSLEEECHTMREEVENLNWVVLTATLCQVLDTFVEGKEPLKRLVEGALSLVGTGSFPEGQGGFLKTLQPLTATFFTHAQQMLLAADLVLARCTNSHTRREIGEQVEFLKRLLASVPALLAEMSGSMAGVNAAEKLQSLFHTWAFTTESLLRCFEATVSVRELLQLSVQEMAQHRESCERALERQDAKGLSRHAAHLAAWARWVADATARHVDRAADPVFRNGLLVWVEQLARSILELKAAAALGAEGLSCRQARDGVSKAASCLMDTACHVLDGLDGSNHPDILSPLRARVRSAGGTEALELGLWHTGLKPSTDEAAQQDDIFSRPSPGAGHSQPGAAPGKGDTHPAVTALLAATRARDTAAVSAACSALLELANSCISAAKEALPVSEPSRAETLGQHHEIVFMAEVVISLARDTALGQPRHPGRLLQMAQSLSKRLCETQECLAAVTGSWYSLAQQVSGFISSAEFLRGKEALDETMAGLAGAVRLAGDIASEACRKGNPISCDVWNSFQQVQAKFSRAQMNTQMLLEKAASCKGSSLEPHCVQWAVGMHALLHAVDQFIGRDVLLLRELRSAVKNKLCSQSLLAAVAENSLRLQEAARLSYLSCPEDGSCSDILALREEIKVLMEALLEASSALSVSQLSAASLYVRFELLQRELALRAKALQLHLEEANTEHLRVIRDVLAPALSPLSPKGTERSREAFEERAGQLVANVQWVRATLQDVLETSAPLPSEVNLLSVADHLLVLTSDAVGTASQHFQSHGDTGHLHLDSVVWYWSAMAHYLVTQLRAARGVGGDALRLIRQRLQNAGDRRSPSSTARLFPAPEPEAPSQGRSAGQCPSGSGRARRAARGAGETVQ